MKLKFDFNRELQKGDSEESTYGCRANNPDICANNEMKGVCAFASEDNICKKPSRAWRKQYIKLLNKNEENK